MQVMVEAERLSGIVPVSRCSAGGEVPRPLYTTITVLLMTSDVAVAGGEAAASPVGGASLADSRPG